MQTASFSPPWLLPLLSAGGGDLFLLRNIPPQQHSQALTPLVTRVVMFRGIGKSARTVLPGGKREAAELPLTAGGELVKAGGDAFIFRSHSGASVLLIGTSQAPDQCLRNPPPRASRAPTSRSSLPSSWPPVGSTTTGSEAGLRATNHCCCCGFWISARVRLPSPAASVT